MTRPAPGVASASGRHCAVWPLPRNSTCAGAARNELRRALRLMALPGDLVNDATLAVSELVSNAYLHVISRRAGGGPADLELWLYRRGRGDSAQVVCKVFDTLRSHAPLVASPTPFAENSGENGRGLGIVDAVVTEWGCHVTRSRLGNGWSIPGKAVWFAMSVPPYPDPPAAPMTAARAAYALQDGLAARGIPRAIRCDDHDLAILPVRPDLTVYCREGAFSWTLDGGHVRHPYADLVEACEQLVRLHEELAINDAAARGQSATFTGIARRAPEPSVEPGR